MLTGGKAQSTQPIAITYTCDCPICKKSGHPRKETFFGVSASDSAPYIAAEQAGWISIQHKDPVNGQWNSHYAPGHKKDG